MSSLTMPCLCPVHAGISVVDRVCPSQPGRCARHCPPSSAITAMQSSSPRSRRSLSPTQSCGLNIKRARDALSDAPSEMVGVRVRGVKSWRPLADWLVPQSSTPRERLKNRRLLLVALTKTFEFARLNPLSLTTLLDKVQNSSLGQALGQASYGF